MMTDSSKQVVRAAVPAGFNLPEMLTVVGIVGLLAALILPAIQQARESARRTQWISNIRQLGVAMHSYAEVYQFIPPGNTNGYSAFVLLLPFLEQTSLFAEFNLAELAQSSANQQFTGTSLAILNLSIRIGRQSIQGAGKLRSECWIRLAFFGAVSRCVYDACSGPRPWGWVAQVQFDH